MFAGVGHSALPCRVPVHHHLSFTVPQSHPESSTGEPCTWHCGRTGETGHSTYRQLFIEADYE